MTVGTGNLEVGHHCCIHRCRMDRQTCGLKYIVMYISNIDGFHGTHETRANGSIVFYANGVTVLVAVHLRLHKSH